MKITSRQLAQGLYRVLDDQPEQSQKIIEEFIDYCAEKNLTGMLAQVARHLEELQKKHQEKNRIQYYARRRLDSKDLARIKKMVNGQSAEVLFIQDHGLVGGLKAEYQNKIYDFSVRNMLTQVRRTLLSSR